MEQWEHQIALVLLENMMTKQVSFVSLVHFNVPLVLIIKTIALNAKEIGGQALIPNLYLIVHVDKVTKIFFKIKILNL